ncbi:MAG TPA: HlyD family efflux transporter periplasmic adaptor subunit [Gemmatimonadales bacterium]|nr:HlyD family efflux transporter periplasmic adaptor subunit [Gemmatimonadales bacterium]
MSCALVVLGCGRAPKNAYEARGTVEVHEVDLAAMTPAKVITVRVDEGAQVRAGDTLAVLGQIELPATLDVQRARLAMAEAKLRDLEAGSRPQEIKAAEAEVAAAEAEAARTAKALERARSLVQDNAIARQQYDDAVAANRVAEERVKSAREALNLARAGTRPQQIQAARSEVADARAALEQVQARASGLLLTTPVSGIVLGRHAEPGEVLGAGAPVLTIGETGRPFVRVFIPQSVVSWLAVGAPVEVVPESGAAVRGRVAAINPKAEFTPRVALSEQERADLMFGVKVEFLDPAEAPHPGLWVRVRVNQGAGSRGQGVGER